MKFIANVLTKNLFNNPLYNVVSKKEDLIDGIPTLCIGKEFTQKNYPEFNIIEFNVIDNVFWTYGPREKRNIYEERLLKFNDVAIKSFINGINYIFINPIIMEKESNERACLSSLLKSKNKTTSFIHNDMAYVFDEIKDCVYGISLRDIDYCGGDSKRFMSMLFKNTDVINNDYDLPSELKHYFYNANYAIPCLYS